MTLSEIDKSLAQWEVRLSSAAQNLFDLQGDPTYQCLAGSGGMPKTQLTGVSAAKVQPALENIAMLYQCFDLLRSTIDRAAQLRRAPRQLFSSDQREIEIAQLLSGRSIRMPASQTPRSQRSLLTGGDSQGCISPDELLRSMVQAFDGSRDVILSVDTAWRQLGDAFGDAVRQIAALRAPGETLQPDESIQLDALESRLGELRANALTDPLGTSENVDAVLRPVLDRVQAAVDARARLRRQVDDAFAAARANQRRIVALHRETKTASALALEKILGAAALPAPLPDQKSNALGDWLEVLQQKYAEGLLQPVAIGLQNWNIAAQNCVSDMQKVYAAVCAPVELRDELRGRMKALRAKALAFHLEEDAELMALAAEAETLLYTRPTAVDRALEMVTRYQNELTARTLGKVPK